MSGAKACTACTAYSERNKTQTPCVVKTIPENLNPDEYNKVNDRYICRHKPPELNPITFAYVDIYSKCQMARTGMGEGLDYGVLLAVAEKRKVYDLEDMLFYANEVEMLKAKEREKKRK